MKYWYERLDKDPDCLKGAPWRDSIETRIEHLKFQKELLLERPSTNEGEAPTLSQLPNRDSLQSELGVLLADNRPTAVIFIDLDNFKKVNDTLGHEAGTECLEKVVKLLASAAFKKGKLYRYGGDEFVLVLPNYESAEAKPTGERIRKAIGEGNPGGTIKVTASVGVVSSDRLQTTDPKTLLEAADGAMYSAKRSGENRVKVWEEKEYLFSVLNNLESIDYGA